MFLWACFLAFVLESSLALFLVGSFYTLRERTLDALERITRSLLPDALPWVKRILRSAAG